MIRFFLDEYGQLRVQQGMVAPSIYLDHWALRDISADKTFRRRFTQALIKQGGTLTLSWLNLLEFTKVTDPSQADAAEELVDDLLPNVFFIETNPFIVLEAEDALLAGVTPFPPHADMQFLNKFAKLKNDSPRLFTAKNLFTTFQKSDLANNLDLLADTLVERIEALRNDFLSETQFASQVRKLPCGPAIPHGTWYILRELVRPALLDQSSKYSRNHAIDLLHAVVPLAYCNIVLLDGHWKEQTEKLRKRVADANMKFPIAKVFSKRTDGLSTFFAFMENDV